MFTIGCHVKDFRRTTDVLKHSRSEPFDFDFYKQDKDFYIFEFPNSDYEDFKNIVILLKNNGVNALGADEQLSEKNIMKLTNLLKEQGEKKSNPMETAEDIIMMVDEIITDNPDTALDLLERMVEDYKENQSIDREEPSIEEQKLRKLIQKLIKE